jgi:hypothetical protein
MQVKYTDPSLDKDVWCYVPGLRRVTRLGAGNRCDSLGGFVYINDDGGPYWCGDTPKFNWKLLEVKDHLVYTLWREDSPGWQAQKNGETWVKGAHHLIPTLERRKMWVIEQTPKFEGYCLSKRIFLQDPESWYFCYGDGYDRAGRLWKTNDMAWVLLDNDESTGGGHVVITAGGNNLDLRIWESAPHYQRKLEVNRHLLPDLFTIDAMRRMGR